MAEGKAELSGLDIRALTTLEEFQRTLGLQKRIWGFDESDVVAPRLFGVYRHIGGSVLGAFAGGEMVGYALAFAGFKSGRRIYWHSHMAGVIPELQGRGIGRRLKLRQREEALAAGIDLIEWAFDPLQARNAYFNLERLGVVVREYVPNLYGLTSSDLHGSLPTDRLIAAWHLESPRVLARIAGNTSARDDSGGAIDIPKDIAAMPREEASAIQARVRSEFHAAFADGCEATGFAVGHAAGRYLLSQRVM